MKVSGEGLPCSACDSIFFQDAFSKPFEAGKFVSPALTPSTKKKTMAEDLKNKVPTT
jgi:hypothetical protein